MAEINQNSLSVGEVKAIGEALVRLIQGSPFLTTKTKVKLEDIDLSCMGVYPTQGTVYLAKFLSGAFLGQYNFFIRFRIRTTNDMQRTEEMNRLDALAQWLEKRTVEWNGTNYKLEYYPELTDNRQIQKIERRSDVFLAQQYDNGDLDFQTQLTLTYHKS